MISIPVLDLPSASDMAAHKGVAEERLVQGTVAKTAADKQYEATGNAAADAAAQC